MKCLCFVCWKSSECVYRSTSNIILYIAWMKIVTYVPIFIRSCLTWWQQLRLANIRRPGTAGDFLITQHVSDIPDGGVEMVAISVGLKWSKSCSLFCVMCKRKGQFSFCSSCLRETFTHLVWDGDGLWTELSIRNRTGWTYKETVSLVILCCEV